QEFRIAVDGKISPAGTSGGTVKLAWTPPDFNDAFAAAVQLDGSTYHELRGANVGATREPGEPKHCGEPRGASVWYSWKPYFRGKAVAQIAGAVRKCVAVYSGTSLSNLVPVGTYPFRDEDDKVWFDVDSLTTYFIAVDGLL